MFERLKFWKKNKNKNITNEELLWREEQRKVTALHNERMKMLDQQLDVLKRKRREEAIQEQIAELYDDDEEEDYPDDNPDDMLQNLAMNFLKSKINPLANISTTAEGRSSPSSSAVELTDVEIENILSKFNRKQINMFSSLDIDTQKKIIKSYLPNISDASINKSLMRIK